MRRHLNLFVALFGVAILWVNSPGDLLLAQNCNQFMVPKKLVNGKLLGQEDCRMQETTFIYQRRKYRRVDMGISGTVDGYSIKEGRRSKYFSDGPEFIFPQYGPHYDHRDWVHGTAEYEGSAGVGMTVLYPDSETAWNHKLYVHIHERGFCAGEGSGSTALDRYHRDPLRDVSKYDKLMLDKGYAVARSRQTVTGTTSTDQDVPRCSTVTLDNGTVLIDGNFTDHAGLHLGFVKLIENFLKSRLGQEPSRTYWYGHSSGARVGRLINYKAGWNIGQNGQPLIDGFLVDDSASGLWLPVSFKDGKDILFATEKQREQFVKQIDITHQLYIRWLSDPVPEWVSKVFIISKRNNAKLLREKGLGSKHRMYEVRGVSHSGGDYGDGKKEGVEILDLSKIMEALIDLLDDWVEQGIEPPPTKSDWLQLGDIDGDGINENPAIALPEVECPLGVYYSYPLSLGERGAGSTAFATFDDTSLEPLDSRGVFVDMNRNGYHDYRESVTEAWQRLDLLKSGEKFSRDKYVNCVKAVAAQLSNDNFITQKVANLYIEHASKARLPSQ